MLRNNTVALLIAAAVVSAIGTTQVHAVQRAHVSAAFGVDTNTATGCTPVAPCRTFQSAMTVTDPNGEVVVLDSGGYGAVTIAQSVALIAPTGVYAGISVFPGADGVTIATPGVNVVLRGLTINGQGGNNGIKMTAGNTLTVEDCVFSNLAIWGINVSGISTVRVTNVSIRDNLIGGVLLQNGARGTITRAVISGVPDLGTGVLVRGTIAGTTTTADVADSTIDGSRKGATAESRLATADVKLSIRDSRVTRNFEVGISADIAAGIVGASSVSASNNIISNNAIGIRALNAGAKVWASGNTVSDNTTFGLSNENGALFESAGSNAVRNNGTNKSGGINVVPTE